MAEGFESWAGRRFRDIDLSDTVWKETMLVNARFSGLITGLVVNDIEVAPLIEAELDRRFPVRLQLRPRSRDELPAAWSVIEDLWTRSKSRVAALDEPLLHTRPEPDEFSWAEHYRHLVFVTDAWISKNALGVEDWHPIGMPPSFWPPPEGVDMTLTPSWSDVIAAREDRMALVRDHLVDVDLDCARVVLDEEWAHDWYANRDLDQLSASER